MTSLYIKTKLESKTNKIFAISPIEESEVQGV